MVCLLLSSEPPLQNTMFHIIYVCPFVRLDRFFFFIHRIYMCILHMCACITECMTEIANAIVFVSKMK